MPGTNTILLESDYPPVKNNIKKKKLPRWHEWERTCLTVQEKQEIQVRFLGQEDALEKGMTAHSSTLAWRIPWIEEPGGLQSMESERVRCDLAT